MTYSNLLVGFTEPETITPQYDHDFYYVLRDGNQGIGFYRTGTSTEVAAYTACLRLPEAQEYAGVNFIRFTLADGTVGVEEVKSERVRSEESAGAVYDLNGQHHSSLQRGVNIVRSANGKTRKVVVR